MSQRAKSVGRRRGRERQRNTGDERQRNRRLEKSLKIIESNPKLRDYYYRQLEINRSSERVGKFMIMFNAIAETKIFAEQQGIEWGSQK